METLTETKIQALHSQISGRIITPSDADYDESRKIWNGMIDRRPSLIIQCKNSNDISLAIQFSKENNFEISIRGAGHNIAGNALCDQAVLIDLSTMKNIKVDAAKKVAYAEPGCTLAEFDAATQKHGLATPVGVNSTTGIAGLTLGGGVGWLTRKYGLTIDNLLSAELVTADGEILKVSENNYSDLFWAIRGGGGNFGVVSLFEFSLHDVGPEVFTSVLVFPLDQAKHILGQYYNFTTNAPEDLCVITVCRHAPPLPFLPENVHGQKVLILAACYTGEAQKGDEFISILRSFGDPYGEMTGNMPYVDWQKLFDPLLTPGLRNYWKSHNFTELNYDFFDKLIDFVHQMPSPHCEIFIADFGGAANRVPVKSTAYPNRDTKYVMNVHGRWENKEDDQKCIAWARNFFQASKPFASAGAFINFMTAEEADRIESAYHINYRKLVEVKRIYDPENVFHHNQNIKPD